jgi:selenocysteine lyase/cysteine desulfurase
MIYFDSAATTFQKPPEVAAAMWDALASMSSPGRGGYPAAVRAADMSFQCRSELAELFGLSNPEQVVFTLNATHALNLAIKSLVPPRGRAVISGYEHNAVTRPLAALRARVEIAAGPLFQPEAVLSAFDRLIVPGVDAVICSHVSNVFGFVQPRSRPSAGAGKSR